MAELKNEFTWSFSRAQAFESCRRRYWFRYHAFWGGWRSDAPELARRAYFFSKMTALPMLIGSAVHETIADVLRAKQGGREPKSPFEQVRLRLNEAWLSSKNERWREVGPKQAPPLFEHWYGVPPSKEELAGWRDRAQASIRGFLESELYRQILRAGPAAFRSIDQLETSAIDGVPCFVAPDFAFVHGEETWIIDWKSGDTRDGYALQLLAYAEHARQKWRLEPSRIRAFDLFLTRGEQVEVPVSEEALAGARREIRASAETMRPLVQREELPPTTDPAECRRCFFRELCDERPDRGPLTPTTT